MAIRRMELYIRLPPIEPSKQSDTAVVRSGDAKDGGFHGPKPMTRSENKLCPAGQNWVYIFKRRKTKS